jgi:hypothetical protein
VIRRLDPDADRELYRQRWEWRERYPRSLRDATAVDSVATFEEFLEQARGARADVGIFDNELIGCVTIQWQAEGVYEIHLSAKRGVRLEQMIEACLSIQKTIFEELSARFIFAFTPEWNKGTIMLATIMGLVPDGIRRLRGTTRGRAIEWMRLSQSRADYERDTTAKPDADGDRAILPDRQFNFNEHAGSEYARHQSAA